jgi:hypothetical protein
VQLGLALAIVLTLAAAAARADPWFTGPLEAPAAIVSAPRELTLQPALVLADGRATFGQNGQRIATTHPSYSINPQLLIEYGLLERLQFTLNAQAEWNRDSGESASGVGDTQLGLGLALLEEDRLSSLQPAARLDFLVTLPTGEYQRLDSGRDGADALGGGSYVATLRLNTAKTFALGEHVFRPHACIELDFYASRVDVHGANTYGGGRGTRGTVAPGGALTAYLSLEYALSQRWALALDGVYTRSAPTRFHGDPGVGANGAPAQVGSERAVLYSIAPAVEYSWSASRGIVVGATFDLVGRNASQAIGLQVQYSATFEPF